MLSYILRNRCQRVMRIRLKNFRYHRDVEYEFPGEGLIALSGVSGSGKSTVLSAIAYAFYGKIPTTGKVKTPYSYEAKTSTVELELYRGEGQSSLLIVRDAKPKRLLVTLDEVEYEDDAAQSIIETELSMNYEEFLAGVYIVQRSNASVLSMTPKEQLHFVEILANYNGPHGAQEFKEKIKNAIQDCKEEKLKKQGELESLEIQLEDLIVRGQEDMECEVPEEIQAGADPDEIRKKLSRHQEDLAKVNTELQALQTTLNKMREEEKSFADTRKKIQKFQTEIDIYEKTLIDLRATSGTDEEFEASKQAVTDAEEALKRYEACTKVYNDVLQLNEAVKAHYSALDEKIAKIRNSISIESSESAHDRVEELERQAEELAEQAREYDVRKSIAETSRKQKDEAKKKLAELFKQIKTNRSFATDASPTLSQIKTPNKMIAFLQSISKICLTCPSCHVSLSYDEHTKTAEIEPSTCDSQTSIGASRLEAMRYIKLIEDSGKALSVEIDDPGSDRPPVDDAVKELNRLKRIIEELETLEKRELSVTLFKMGDKIRVAAELLKIDDSIDAAVDFLEKNNAETYKSALEDAKQNQNEMKRTRGKIEETKAEITKRKAFIKKLKADLPSSKIQNDISEMEKKLSSMTQRSGEINADITTLRDLLDSFADYEKYLAYQTTLEGVKKKIKICKSKMKKLDGRLEGLYGLQEAGKEAEILSLEETVRSINEHAKFYLDEMFDEPISVRLSCVKELKSGNKGPKLQMNTIIEQNGVVGGDIDDLSGGERQRCDMAFLLAVNDMLGAKMLLLDECLNNLDAEINTEVLSMIRDLCGGDKMILVVSHEAVRGIFDSEVQFNKH